MRYKFYPSGNKVVCVSSYAGKAVRGIAKCDPKDTFNLEDGKKLAQARCDAKIAQKRVLRSRARYNEALKMAADAQDYLNKMQSYYEESFKDFKKATEELKALEATM